MCFLVTLFCGRTFCDHPSKAAVGVELKQLYINVMNDMKEKFQGGEMNSQQKKGATEVIVETQNLLGKFSLQVLGLDVGNRNYAQIFNVLKGFKEAGNMTEEQDTAMQKLAEQTQVRMIQGILKVFGFSAERAAKEYNVPLPEMELLLQHPTFQSDFAEQRRIEKQLEDLVTYPPNYEDQASAEDNLLDSISIGSSIVEKVGPIVCEGENGKCSDGTCLPSRWWCDGENDCADGSDESDCSSLSGARRQQCDPDRQRQCEDGACLSKEVWCDGHTDCSDGTDEGLDCPQLSCSGMRWGAQWRCKDNKRCVLKRWLCDGMEDCFDGSDEKGCEEPLICDKDIEFQCKDGSKCLRKDWLCDNFQDCLDGSDELNCKNVSEAANAMQNTNMKSVTSDYELTATQMFNFESQENGQAQEDEDGDQIWIIVLVFSLISAFIAALLSIMVKCKCDRKAGQGGVWVTRRTFGEGRHQNDRIELCQA